MTEQLDLDALEALRRYREAELPDAGYAYLADALESTLAELRQERERADDLLTANAGLVDAVYATDAALSRAEETIDRARAAIGDANEWDGHGRADQLDNTRRILSEYGKQKEGLSDD